jgi:hypothetical protein
MKRLTIDEVIQLKKAVKDAVGVEVHYHDTCGGMYFTFDENKEGLRKFVESYFAEKGMEVAFDEVNKNFVTR